MIYLFNAEDVLENIILPQRFRMLIDSYSTACVLVSKARVRLWAVLSDCHLPTMCS